MAFERYFLSARPERESRVGLFPYHCPLGKQALYTRTTRCTYDVLQLPCLSCDEVQRVIHEQKGKLATLAALAAASVQQKLQYRDISTKIHVVLEMHMKKRANSPLYNRIVRLFVFSEKFFNIYNVPRA